MQAADLFVIILITMVELTLPIWAQYNAWWSFEEFNSTRIHRIIAMGLMQITVELPLSLGYECIKIMG